MVICKMMLCGPCCYADQLCGDLLIQHIQRSEGLDYTPAGINTSMEAVISDVVIPQ